MSRATLPAEARLHRPAEYAAALKGRRLARGALFVVSAATLTTPSVAAPPARAGGSVGHSSNSPAPAAEVRQQAANEPRARLGLVIAKRYAPRAVTRNALKRVVREAFRAQRLALPARDYVVRLQGKVAPVSLTELKRAARAEADAHFGRIAQ